MQCDCGKKARVTSTNNNRRRYECGYCQAKFITVEYKGRNYEDAGKHLAIDAARRILRQKGYLK